MPAPVPLLGPWVAGARGGGARQDCRADSALANVTAVASACREGRRWMLVRGQERAQKGNTLSAPSSPHRAPQPLTTAVALAEPNAEAVAVWPSDAQAVAVTAGGG